MSQPQQLVVRLLTSRCYNCHEVGHYYNDCPKPKMTLCYNCHLEGHKTYECATRKNCHNCHDISHTAKECPSKNLSPQCSNKPSQTKNEVNQTNRKVSKCLAPRENNIASKGKSPNPNEDLPSRKFNVQQSFPCKRCANELNCECTHFTQAMVPNHEAVTEKGRLPECSEYASSGFLLDSSVVHEKKILKTTIDSLSSDHLRNIVLSDLKNTSGATWELEGDSVLGTLSPGLPDLNTTNDENNQQNESSALWLPASLTCRKSIHPSTSSFEETLSPQSMKRIESMEVGTITVLDNQDLDDMAEDASGPSSRADLPVLVCNCKKASRINNSNQLQDQMSHLWPPPQQSSKMLWGGKSSHDTKPFGLSECDQKKNPIHLDLRDSVVPMKNQYTVVSFNTLKQLNSAILSYSQQLHLTNRIPVEVRNLLKDSLQQALDELTKFDVEESFD